MPIIIKGIHVDAGRPMVCVPVTEKTPEKILAETEVLVAAGVRMIEWRVDCFEGYARFEEVREILDSLLGITKETVLLATVRTVKQGGNADLDAVRLAELYDVIAQAHAADIIDVEAFSFTGPSALIDSLHKRGALVLLSHHEFGGTPENAVMEEQLKKMAVMDGDIVKLAVMPENVADTMRLLAVADDFRRGYPRMPFLAIAMGEYGVLSRIAGECVGSCITFAAGRKASAPGQLPVAEMKDALDLIHRVAVGEKG